MRHLFNKRRFLFSPGCCLDGFVTELMFRCQRMTSFLAFVGSKTQMPSWLKWPVWFDWILVLLAMCRRQWRLELPFCHNKTWTASVLKITLNMACVFPIVPGDLAHHWCWFSRTEPHSVLGSGGSSHRPLVLLQHVPSSSAHRSVWSQSPSLLPSCRYQQGGARAMVLNLSDFKADSNAILKIFLVFCCYDKAARILFT